MSVDLSTGDMDSLPVNAAPSSFFEWQSDGHTYVSTTRTDSLSPAPEYDPIYNVEIYDIQTGKGEVVMSRPGKGGLIDGPVASWCTP